MQVCQNFKRFLSLKVQMHGLLWEHYTSWRGDHFQCLFIPFDSWVAKAGTSKTMQSGWTQEARTELIHRSLLAQLNLILNTWETTSHFLSFLLLDGSEFFGLEIQLFFKLKISPCQSRRQIHNSIQQVGNRSCTRLHYLNNCHSYDSSNEKQHWNLKTT